MSFLRVGLLTMSCAAALGAAGCSGGCGEEPKEAAQTPASSGAGGGGSSSGGSAVAVGERTMASAERGAEQARKPAAGEKAGPGVPAEPRAQPEALAPKLELEDVTRDDFKPKVLDAPGLVLLLTYAPESRPCRQAVLALTGLLPDLGPGIKIYRLEVHTPGHAELLPKGMTAFPIPSFALYEAGRVLSIKQGRPFAPRGGEKEEAYLSRLRDWARAALARKTF